MNQLATQGEFDILGSVTKMAPPPNNHRSIGKRIGILGIIALMLILGGLGYFYLFQSRPIGSGSAGPAVAREAFSKKWSDRPVLLLGLGDSVTAGFGARKGYSYFDRLVANPSDEFSEMQGISLRSVLPNLIVTNLSISGSTSQEHAERQLSRIPQSDSNVVALVVITTGGNDLIHNYGRTPPRDQAMFGASWDEAQPWISGFEERLESMLSKINELFPGRCHIFIANIYDPTDGVGDLERAGLPSWPDGLKILDSYNSIIKRYAEKHSNVHLIDMHSAFLGHGIHCTQFWSKHYDIHDPHYWYFVNLEDPNERGYDVLRRLFLQEMTKISDKLQ